MNRLFSLPLLAAVLLSAGCASSESKKMAMPDSAVATAPATPEQILLGKNRAEAIASRWTEEETKKFTKSASPLLAVRTLGLTPEQSAALGAHVPKDGSAVCVLLWNAKEQKVVGSEVFVVKTQPERDATARFSIHVARYVGSLQPRQCLTQRECLLEALSGGAVLATCDFTHKICSHGPAAAGSPCPR